MRRRREGGRVFFFVGWKRGGGGSETRARERYVSGPSVNERSFGRIEIGFVLGRKRRKRRRRRRRRSGKLCETQVSRVGGEFVSREARG